MSKQNIPSSSCSLPPAEDLSGDNSDDFEELQDQMSSEEKSEDRLREEELGNERLRNEEKVNFDGEVEEMKKEIVNLKSKLATQSSTIEKLKYENMLFSSKCQNYENQIQTIQKKLISKNQQNEILISSNTEIKQSFDALKEESNEFIDKISCLQQTLELQKQDNQAKLNALIKDLQVFEKADLKNLDNKTILTNLSVKLQAMKKVLLKIDDVWSILALSKNNRVEEVNVFEEKMIKLHGIKDILLRQQNRINEYKEGLTKLQKSGENHNEGFDSLSSGISKWLDPVMKFCNIENGKGHEKKENKNGSNQ